MQQQHPSWFDDNGTPPGGPTHVKLLTNLNEFINWQRFDNPWDIEPQPQHISAGFNPISPTTFNHSYLDLTEIGGHKNYSGPSRPILPRRLQEEWLVTQQVAQSVEELSKRQRKLDHLQRCLKRYEIERDEAGEAVKRIEKRLQELVERTTDLLDTKVPTNNRSTMTLDRSDRSHPKNGRLINSKSNRMYLDVDKMLDLENSNGYPPQRYPHQDPQRWMRQSERRRARQATPLSPELRDIQQCYAKLSEHLVNQRGRLAKADSTVTELLQAVSCANEPRTNVVDLISQQQRLPVSHDHEFTSIAEMPRAVAAPTPIRINGLVTKHTRVERGSARSETPPRRTGREHTGRMRQCSNKSVRDSDYIHLSQTDTAFPGNTTNSAFHCPLKNVLQPRALAHSPLVHSKESINRPPPIPPRLSKKELASKSCGQAQTVEDEEVSQLMSAESAIDDEQGELGYYSRATNGGQFSDPASVKRPLPPPYYVNLSHPTNSESETANLELIGHKSNEVDAKENKASEKNNSRVYKHPLSSTSMDLEQILRMEGHPLDELTTKLPDVTTTRLPKNRLHTAACFGSMIGRLFRPNGTMSRPHRDKLRARSLDESLPPMMQIAPETSDEIKEHLTQRIVLSRTRCEGYLWMMSRTDRQRVRAWHTLRSRGWSDSIQAAFSHMGRASPVTNKKQWRMRWFVCDFDYRIVAYYGEQRDDKLRESITFSSIREILDDAIPQHKDLQPIDRTLNHPAQGKHHPIELVFGLFSVNGTYLFRAPCEQIRMLWLSVLRLAKSYGGSI